MYACIKKVPSVRHRLMYFLLFRRKRITTFLSCISWPYLYCLNCNILLKTNYVTCEPEIKPRDMRYFLATYRSLKQLYVLLSRLNERVCFNSQFSWSCSRGMIPVKVTTFVSFIWRLLINVTCLTHKNNGSKRVHGSNDDTGTQRCYSHELTVCWFVSPLRISVEKTQVTPKTL